MKDAELIPRPAANIAIKVGEQHKNPEKNEGTRLNIPVEGFTLHALGASVNEKTDREIFIPVMNPKNNPNDKFGIAMLIRIVSREIKIIGSQLKLALSLNISSDQLSKTRTLNEENLEIKI